MIAVLRNPARELEVAGPRSFTDVPTAAPAVIEGHTQQSTRARPVHVDHCHRRPRAGVPTPEITAP